MKHYWLSAVAFISIFFTAQGQPNTATGGLPWGAGLKVLIVGGGWAHDYQTWDNRFDTELLHKAGITSTQYTEDSDTVVRELPRVDVLLMSCNKGGFDTEAFRNAVRNFVKAGKGVVFLHSGTFYSWKWDEMYTNYVGGGAHGHDGPAEFTETVLKDHPVVKGVPKTFKITDELYHIVPIPGGSPMEVLIEAKNSGGEVFPSVWITHFPGSDARIVCDALGHDNFPRTTPEFTTLLINAVKWAGRQ
jgi:type 1 glutamine amidotransferase